MFRIVRVNNFQVGLRFKREKLIEALPPGWYLAMGFMGERIDVLSEKELFLAHKELDEIIRSGLLSDMIETVDLKDDERALLWVDGRFSQILTTGRYAIWKRFREIRLERMVVTDPVFSHKNLFQIAKNLGNDAVLSTVQVEPGETCLFFKDGKFAGELAPGFHAFWKQIATLKFIRIDQREKVLEMSGQDIMTADKVTLRLNAVVNFRITDALKSVQVAEAPEQVLYREAQLLLRSAVGTRKLDEILNDKDSLAGGIMEMLNGKAEKIGLSLSGFGIRDIILPGDMRNLLNRVVEAQKVAEANQIARREETAATRSQCNTAKLLTENPILMRLRELEVIERVAGNSKLNLVVGEKGLADKLVNML